MARVLATPPLCNFSYILAGRIPQAYGAKALPLMTAARDIQGDHCHDRGSALRLRDRQ